MPRCANCASHRWDHFDHLHDRPISIDWRRTPRLHVCVFCRIARVDLCSGREARQQSQVTCVNCLLHPGGIHVLLSASRINQFKYHWIAFFHGSNRLAWNWICRLVDLRTIPARQRIAFSGNFHSPRPVADGSRNQALHLRKPDAQSNSASSFPASQTLAGRSNPNPYSTANNKFAKSTLDPGTNGILDRRLNCTLHLFQELIARRISR